MATENDSQVARLILVRFIESRERSGRTKAFAASELGVTTKALQHWLNGKRNPTKTVVILAGLLTRSDSGQWPL